jgi:hypothetical protein
MSRKLSKVMSPLARTRAERRALRAEMARIAEFAKQKMREAVLEGLIAGRIEEDGEIVLDDTAGLLAPMRTKRK